MLWNSFAKQIGEKSRFLTQNVANGHENGIMTFFSQKRHFSLKIGKTAE
jgi:hypothetical protein